MNPGPKRFGAWTWDPPKCGDTLPDGRSRVESVVIDASTGPGVYTHIEVGFALAGQVRYRAWPCTNRRAKRQRCKARRRERLARRAKFVIEHIASVSRPLRGIQEAYDAVQRPINMNYVALMPDGSTETVVDGQAVYRSEPDSGVVEALSDCGEISVGYGVHVAAPILRPAEE